MSELARKKYTVRTFRKMRKDGEKIVMLTAFDAPTARFAETAGVDLILVGDSLGMNTLGYHDTIPVTMNDMIHHCQCVRRGAPNTFIVGDMPYLSYHTSIEAAILNAGRFMQEGQCDCVKLESDHSTIPLIARLIQAGIPVMAHIGLLPQSLKVCGSYRVAGRAEDEAQALIDDAKAIQDAGAFSVVLECVPAALSQKITDLLEIPTIGIGAGAGCSGQVQVISDVLGFDASFQPKHSKCYLNVQELAQNAIHQYVTEVKDGVFPSMDNAY